MKFHDLQVQSGTLLLVDEFKNFRNMCLEMYQLDPSHFFSTLQLAQKADLIQTKGKLDLLTDID